MIEWNKDEIFAKRVELMFPPVQMVINRLNNDIQTLTKSIPELRGFIANFVIPTFRELRERTEFCKQEGHYDNIENLDRQVNYIIQFSSAFLKAISSTNTAKAMPYHHILGGVYIKYLAEKLTHVLEEIRSITTKKEDQSEDQS